MEVLVEIFLLHCTDTVAAAVDGGEQSSCSSNQDSPHPGPTRAALSPALSRVSHGPTHMQWLVGALVSCRQQTAEL